MLDNGVAEGERLDGRELYEAAVRVKPTELVLPDVVGCARTTYQDSYAFLSDYGAALAVHEIGFVYVLQAGPEDPQGDLSWGLSNALSLHEEWPITAVAISKFYSRDVGSRICAVDYVLGWLDGCGSQSYPEIHLLGLYSDILELTLIERTWPGRIRGCDTSWPFIVALKGTRVTMMRGPDDVIDLSGDADYSGIYPNVFAYDLRQMDALAGGDACL